MAISLTRLDPFFRKHFEGGIDTFFDDIFNDISYAPARAQRKGPKTDVKKTEAGHEISVVAPGLKKKDFKITLENDILCISHEQKSENAHALSQKSFKYSWKAPKGISGENISAKYDAGILTIFVESPLEEKIPVETIQVK